MTSSGEPLTILLTGANTGIGLETAKQLVMYHPQHDINITVRDSTKGEATLATLKSLNSDCKVQYFTVELSNLKSIKDFAETWNNSGKKLDVLINNAGMGGDLMGKKRETLNGDPKIEPTVFVNCMGTFLLTNLLLDNLRAASAARGEGVKSRIINVGSTVTTEFKEPFYIDDIMLEDPAHYKSGMQAYRVSKIGLHLWTKVLAEKLKDEMIVTVLCPGVIPNTDLARGISNPCMKCLMSMFTCCCFKTDPVSAGAERIFQLGLEEEGLSSNGKFYSQGAPRPETPEVDDPANQAKIWEICEKYTRV